MATINNTQLLGLGYVNSGLPFTEYSQGGGFAYKVGGGITFGRVLDYSYPYITTDEAKRIWVDTMNTHPRKPHALFVTKPDDIFKFNAADRNSVVTDIHAKITKKIKPLVDQSIAAQKAVAEAASKISLAQGLSMQNGSAANANALLIYSAVDAVKAQQAANGNTQNSTQNQQQDEPQPPTKKPNWLLIGGIGLGVVALVTAVVIATK